MRILHVYRTYFPDTQGGLEEAIRQICRATAPHGVRNTAAGLRYVLYAFLSDLAHPERVTHSPGGYLLAPIDEERVGDVSNVLFCNGAVARANGEIAAPTLVIVGDRDVPGIVENADRLATGIAGARKVVLPDVAHLPPMERPDEFNRLVLDFLGAR